MVLKITNIRDNQQLESLSCLFDDANKGIPLIKLAVFVLFFMLSNDFLLANANNDKEKQDTIVQKKFSWRLVPAGYYTPETSLALGLAGLSVFPLEANPNTRKSTVWFNFLYTLNKQVTSYVSGDFFFNENDQAVNFFSAFYYFPSKYYGIGKEEKSKYEMFTPRHYSFWANWRKRIDKNLYAGINFRFKKHALLEYKANCLLDSPNFQSQGNSFVSGAGILLEYDSRDDYQYPHKGAYHKAYLRFYNSVLGSDFNFTEWSLDMRKYQLLFKKHVLALQWKVQLTRGNTPFYMLPELGGTYFMRGYYRGKYRDQNAWSVQAEYRVPVWWRFGVAVFGSAGEVADNLGGFTWQDLQYAGGAGLRFQIFKNQRVNLRLDYAFTKEGETGMYIDFSEAF